MRVEMRNREILDSWKDISEYLGRDIKTCARWEKELGLPIYRIDQDSPRSKVFAYKSEINEWLKEKANHKEIQKKPFLEKKWVVSSIVSAAVLLLAVSATLYFTIGKSSSNNIRNLSVAVLPLESSNFSEYEKYIPEGISKEIGDSLSRFNNLKIIPSTLFKRKNESNKDLKDITEKFNIDYILKTKLEKNDNQLRISTQCVRAEDGKIMWSEESQNRLENYVSLLEDICLKIHKRLNPNNKTLSGLPFSNGQTQDYAALDNYFKGNHILNRSKPEYNDPWKLYIRGKYQEGLWTQESNALAINYFSRAIEIDENFARAYIGLARCYANKINFNWDHNKEWLYKAEELLEKAASINPECPEYYSALIQVYLIKYFVLDENIKDKAFEIAREAIKKYPGHSNLYAKVGYCYYVNFGESGNISDLNKALELHEEYYFLLPYSISNIVFAELLMLHKEYDRALIVCNGIQGGEASMMANFRKGEIYYYMGDLSSSEAVFLQFETLNEIDNQIGALYYLGMIAAQRGDTTEVERLLKKIELITPKKFDYFGDKLKLASIHMGIGEKELGYKFLEDFIAEEITKKTRYIYQRYINLDKNFDNIREEEKFKKIIQ